MMTPERIAEIRERAEHYSSDKQLDYIVADVLDLLAEVEQTWVPVEERLPPAGHAVLVINYDLPYVGWLRDGRWYAFSWSDAIPLSGVEHWRELPAGPIKDGEK